MLRRLKANGQKPAPAAGAEIGFPDAQRLPDWWRTRLCANQATLGP
jgi:hypothetical protein